MDTGGAHILGKQRVADVALDKVKALGKHEGWIEAMLKPSGIDQVWFDPIHKSVIFRTRGFQYGKQYAVVWLDNDDIDRIQSSWSVNESAVLLWEAEEEQNAEPVQLHGGVQAPVVGGSADQSRDEATVEAPSEDDDVPRYEVMLQLESIINDDSCREAWHRAVAAQNKEQVPGTDITIEIKSQGVSAYKLVKGLTRNLVPEPVDKVWWAPLNTDLGTVTPAEAIQSMIVAMKAEGLVPHTDPTFTTEVCAAGRYGKNAPGEDAYRVMGTFVNAAELRLFQSRMEATGGQATPGDSGA